jgi:hypothetical protein
MARMDTDDFIAASRRHARIYARRATEGIRDGKSERFITANAVADRGAH